MNQFKRAQVVMLPSKNGEPLINDIILNVYDKSELGIVTKHNIFNKECFRFGRFGISFRNSYLYNGFQKQNLYIISDEEIKEGDLFLWKSGLDNRFEVHKYHSNAGYGIKTFTYYNKEDDSSLIVNNSGIYGKIIATTDTSLIIECIEECKLTTNIHYSKPLPQPSRQFIEKYIEEYNRGNVITDVLVEYNEIWKSSVYDQPDKYVGEELKINPKDNTITIKKLQEIWNREEIYELFNKLQHEMAQQVIGNRGDKKIIPLDWIKENL